MTPRHTQGASATTPGAKQDVLTRIAQAHHAAPPPELSYSDIARGYRTTSDFDRNALVERLVDRLLDYKALVRQCSAAELPAAVAAAIAERGARRLVIPAGLEPHWMSETSVDLCDDDTTSPLTVAELDGLDGVVTACAIAIAETGTLVLDGTTGMGRRAITLVPDYHLCVVWPAQICADVPQGLARLDLTRPITMISGPSATSDIELNRVEGVHGPRTLEVIVVRDDTPVDPDITLQGRNPPDKVG